jgi:hypothetical protein
MRINPALASIDDLPPLERSSVRSIFIDSVDAQCVKCALCRDAQHLGEATTQHQVGRIAPSVAAVLVAGVADIAPTHIRPIPFLPPRQLLQVVLPEVVEAVQAAVLDRGGHR